MPVLHSNTLEVQQLYLPSTATLPEADQAWVKAEVGPLTTGDVVNGSTPDATPTQQTVHVLVSRIKEWNFTDENGVALDITFDNVCKLDMEDFSYIVSKVVVGGGNAQLSTSEKKV